MNPSRNDRTSTGAVAVISISALVVGCLAAVYGFGPRAPLDDQGQLVDGGTKIDAEFELLKQEVAQLREDNQAMADAAVSRSGLTKELNDRLKETSAFAGLTEAEGPGVTVTLRDSGRPADGGFTNDLAIIHDQDIIAVVNELWNAGAEAIGINGSRIGPMTSIRCVGSTVDIDSVKFAAPIYIRAIGDPQTLIGAMTLRGGVLEEILQLDPDMVEVEIVEKHRLAAYSGTTAWRTAKIPEDDDE